MKLLKKKPKDEEGKPLYDKEKPQVSLKEESLLHKEPQLGTMKSLVNVIQSKSAGDDSYEGNGIFEFDLFSPSWFSEEHQSEGITDASMVGS